MPRALLEYFKNELDWLADAGRQFAKAHPESAGGLSEVDFTGDPHVERLLHGTAFLAARIHQRLDADLPELTTALLEMLYPQLLAPLPSMAVVRFEPPRKGASVPAGGWPVAKGTKIEVRPPGSAHRLTYRTTAETDVWPLRVADAALGPVRPSVAGSGWTPPIDAESVLQIDLQCQTPDRKWNSLQLDDLRLFLCGGGSVGKRLEAGHTLRELLLRTELVAGVEIGSVPSGSRSEPSAVLRLNEGRPVFREWGFEDSEAMLPPTPAMLRGNRLLLEYFAMPERFLFVILDGLQTVLPRMEHDVLRIRTYFRTRRVEIEDVVKAETFGLGCVPVINLFDDQTRVVRLDQRGFEHELVSQTHEAEAFEIHSIDSVHATATHGERTRGAPTVVEPLFRSSPSLPDEPGERRWYWTATRRESLAPRDSGTDVLLSVVDRRLDPFEGQEWVIQATVTCLNRDLPNGFLGRHGSPDLKAVGVGAGLAPEFLTTPTPTRRVDAGGERLLQLVSLLTLNHVTLGDDRSLRALLQLHDRVGDARSRAAVDSLADVSASPSTGLVVDGPWSGMCRGIQVHVEIHDQKFDDGGWHTFVSVLDHMVASYCSVNSFTQLTWASVRRSKEIFKCPKRAGRTIVA